MIRLDHINMSVENLQTSLDWYQHLFGFKPVESGDHKGTPYAIVRKDDVMLCLYQLPQKESPSTSQHHKVYHFGIRIDDPEEWEQKLEDSQVQPHLVWDYPHSKSWYVRDPSGHEIEVCYWQGNRIQFQPNASESL